MNIPSLYQSYARTILIIIIVGVTYHLLAKLGYILSTSPDHIATFWPPNTIILAALLLTDKRHWWVFLFAMTPSYLFAAFQNGYSVERALIFYIANFTEILFAGYALRKMFGRNLSFDTLNEMVWFLLLAVLVSPFISASMAATVGFFETEATYLNLWRVWFLGDALGHLTLTPMIILWGALTLNQVKTVALNRELEIVALLISLVTVTYFGLGSETSTIEKFPGLLFAPSLILLWTTIRFGPRGICTAVFIITIFTIWNAIHGRGPFTTFSNADNVLSLQLYIIAISIPLMLLASLLSERKKSLVVLKESEERYAFAMKGANDGLWDWDLLTDEVHYSPRWKSILGYAENEISNDLSEWKRLIHPDDLDSAVSNAQAFINNDVDKYELEFRMQHKDGHYIDILSRAFAVEDEAGKVTRLVGTHVDITQRKQAEKQLNYQSTHDALTGLVNRREFENRMQRLLATAKEHSQHHALCYMDLDQFKVVNDTCGHTAGDEMLRQLSTMLRQVVRHRDTLARLGGDEFGVLMEHCSLDDAHRVATSIQTAIQDYQFLWEERSFRVSVSMGLVPITDTTFNLTDLLKDADAACYMAKDKGRNRIHVHRDEDKELANRHGEMQWVNRIQQALDDNRFCLYAQSIESLDNATDVHYELLIRMLDEQEEIIPPGAFLPAAERYNLITQLDQWVIENAFKALTENLDFQRQINFISINLSGLSLANETFLDFVVQQFHEHEIKGEKICFEITETAAISNLSKADKFISRLRRLGCRFALDDFGSGLSSFGYLKNLPVNFLKIDGMFVKDMVTDQIDHAMVKSINEIGQVMGMQTIAEFVENDEIKGMLREIGVNYAQGYAIHKPQPFDELLNRSDNVTNINKSKDDEIKS